MGGGGSNPALKRMRCTGSEACAPTDSQYLQIVRMKLVSLIQLKSTELGFIYSLSSRKPNILLPSPTSTILPLSPLYLLHAPFSLSSTHYKSIRNNLIDMKQTTHPHPPPPKKKKKKKRTFLRVYTSWCTHFFPSLTLQTQGTPINLPHSSSGMDIKLNINLTTVASPSKSVIYTQNDEHESKQITTSKAIDNNIYTFIYTGRCNYPVLIWNYIQFGGGGSYKQLILNNK
jgi:hypothetical protein